MASLVATTVDPGGTGDYLTLNACEADNFGASNTDLTVGDEYCVVSCISTNGAADTTSVTFFGQTTDATRNVTVTVPAAYRHKGVIPASGNIYRMECSAGCILSNVECTVLDGLSFKLTTTGNDQFAVLSYHTITVTECIAVLANPSVGHTSPCGFAMYDQTVGGHTFKCRNCKAINFRNSTTSGHGFYGGYAEASTTNVNRWHNCTAGNCRIGFSEYYGSTYVKNCLASGCTFDYNDPAGFVSVTNTNNISSAAGVGISWGATRTTGTTTSATAGKLNDTGKNFVTLGVRVGTVLKNTTDTTYTYVTAVDSTTVLSVANDIFANAENYSIYYNLVGTPTFQNSGSGNYHLVAGTANIAYRTGADLDEDANLAVTTDIDGQSRHATTPCIGADEVSDWDVTGGALDIGSAALDAAVIVGRVVTGGLTSGSATLDGTATWTPHPTAAGTITTGAATISADATYTPAVNIVKKKVDPDNSSGTHYTSLSSWEAAYGGIGGNGDLVGTDQIAVAECYCTAGTADIAPCIVQGWTSTSAARYIKITVASGYRHKGAFPSGSLYRLSVTGNYCLRVYSVDNVYIEWIAARTTANANNQSCLAQRDAENVWWDNCVATIVPGVYTNTRCYMDYYQTAGNVYYRNCLAYGTGTESFYIQNRSGGAMYWHNCGAVGNHGWIQVTNSGCTLTVNNCYAKTSSTSFGSSSGVVYTDSAYNAYCVAADPGTNGVNISGDAEADLFINPGSSNYHIKRTGALYNAGVTLYAHATLPTMTDFHGFPRPTAGACDIGPHEFPLVTGHATTSATTVAGTAENARDLTGVTILVAPTVRGVVTMASTPMDWTASGWLSVAAPTIAGHFGRRFNATGRIVTSCIVQRSTN